MSALPEYYHHLTCHRGSSPAEAMDRLVLVQNGFASHGARRAFFTKLKLGHVGGAAKKGAAKGGGATPAKPAKPPKGLTPAGQEVVGKSVTKETKISAAKSLERDVKKNAAGSAKMKRMF